MKKYYSLLITAIILACQPKSPSKVKNSNITIHTSSSIDKSTNDQDLLVFELKNKNEMTVKVSNYGGIIMSIKVPDRNGKIEDVALGFDTITSYQEAHPYFGAIIGRYGNRIAGGKFNLDDKEYILSKNNGENSLHGGDRGFDKQIWDAELIEGGIRLSRISADMEEGFPGNLTASVEYLLTNDNEIIISYQASTDKPTVCNLTNHTYFNLAGEGKGSIVDHEVSILADNYNPVNAGLIPTGISTVKDTPFDFTHSKKISYGIDADHLQIKHGGGFDHNWVLNNADGKLKLAAVALDSSSGRKMEVFTTEPGIQFYTGNFLDGTLIGKSGVAYGKRSGFCLETQHFPDSPNQKDFPSTILLPGETYSSQTSYKFSVVK